MEENNLFLEITMARMKIIKDALNLVNNCMNKKHCYILFEQGIHIGCMYNDQSIIFELKLKIDNIEYFNCDKSAFRAKFDLFDFCNKIQQINHDHTYSLFIIKNNLNKLFIRNLNEKRQDIIIELLPVRQYITMPQNLFSHQIIMNLKDFNAMIHGTDDIESNLLQINILKNNSGRFNMYSTFDEYTSSSDINAKTEILWTASYPTKVFKCLNILDHNYPTVQLYLKQYFSLCINIPTVTSDILYISIKPVDPKSYFDLVRSRDT